MKVHLMSPVDDFDPGLSEPTFADDLVQDLQLDFLFDAMADGDSGLRSIARAALLAPLTDPAVIAYRQGAYADCAQQPHLTTQLYALAVEALDLKHGVFMTPLHNHPQLELSHSIQLLGALVEQLDRLRSFCASAGRRFESVAFQKFFAMVKTELDDAYLGRLRITVRELSFPEGMLLSAKIGSGGHLIEPVLRRSKEENRRLFDRTPLKRPLHNFNVPEGDQAVAKALSALRDRGVQEVANAAAQATTHVLAFFTALRNEVGFYIAALNLADVLQQIGAPTCTPDPTSTSSMQAKELYDPSLAIRLGSAPVGNAVDLGASRLLVITGANRGGKSTLLRALGCAQLMMQAGLPGPATAFAASPVGRVYTHWAREEDRRLTRGKLDEELARMQLIVADIRPNDLLLCNESFASTNEAEGSQILTEVTHALVAAGVHVRSVTHLYSFAQAIAEHDSLETVFLRASRAHNAERPYLLEPGLPLPTSYGLDLFDTLFGTDYANAK